MNKKFLIFLLLLIIPSILVYAAENYISVTYTFSASTLIRSSYMNTNFNDIITGLNGGIKAINIDKILIDGTEVLTYTSPNVAINVDKLYLDGVQVTDNSGVTENTPGEWTDYSSMTETLGFTTTRNAQVLYKQIGKTVYVKFFIEGTSQTPVQFPYESGHPGYMCRSIVSFTVPFVPKTPFSCVQSSSIFWWTYPTGGAFPVGTTVLGTCFAWDAGVRQQVPKQMKIFPGETLVFISEGCNLNYEDWSDSPAYRRVEGQFSYECQ